jgi:hypothetical protein
MDDLYNALEAILKICNENGNMRVRLDRIHSVAIEAIIAYEAAKQAEETDGKKEN